MRAMGAIRPLAFQAPCDLGLQYTLCTSNESTKDPKDPKAQSATGKPDDWEAPPAVLTPHERTASKRARKAVDRTLDFLRRTIALRAESPVRSAVVFAYTNGLFPFDNGAVFLYFTWL